MIDRKPLADEWVPEGHIPHDEVGPDPSYKMATGIFTRFDELMMAVFPFSDMHAALTANEPRNTGQN